MLYPFGIEPFGFFKIKLSPGALYTSIKQLNEPGLVAEIDRRDDPRRRYYRITQKGKKALGSELEYYENSLVLARQRQVLEMSHGTFA